MDDIRKYINILESEPLDEAKPMGWWSTSWLANIGQKDTRAGKIVLKNLANSEYSRWKQFLGTQNKRENQGDQADLKAFLDANEYPADWVQQAVNTNGVPDFAQSKDVAQWFLGLAKLVLAKDPRGTSPMAARAIQANQRRANITPQQSPGPAGPRVTPRPPGPGPTVSPTPAPAPAPTHPPLPGGAHPAISSLSSQQKAAIKRALQRIGATP